MIQAPKDLRTRPTQSRLRQALFNAIQWSIPEARVLDLFAGSGALGFEALSRGAGSVVFVESRRNVTQLIRRNAEDLRVLDRVKIVEDSVEKAHLEKFAPFDIVLADPPYAEGWETKLLNELPWEELLVPEGQFCLEWSTEKSQVSELPDRVGCLVKVREKNYGDSVLTSYQRESS